jgi:hypothetical protein
MAKAMMVCLALMLSVNSVAAQSPTELSFGGRRGRDGCQWKWSSRGFQLQRQKRCHARVSVDAEWRHD